MDDHPQNNNNYTVLTKFTKFRKKSQQPLTDLTALYSKIANETIYYNNLEKKGYLRKALNGWKGLTTDAIFQLTQIEHRYPNLTSYTKDEQSLRNGIRELYHKANQRLETVQGLIDNVEATAASQAAPGAAAAATTTTTTAVSLSPYNSPKVNYNASTPPFLPVRRKPLMSHGVPAGFSRITMRDMKLKRELGHEIKSPQTAMKSRSQPARHEHHTHSSHFLRHATSIGKGISISKPLENQRLSDGRRDHTSSTRRMSLDLDLGHEQRQGSLSGSPQTHDDSRGFAMKLNNKNIIDLTRHRSSSNNIRYTSSQNVTGGYLVDDDDTIISNANMELERRNTFRLLSARKHMSTGSFPVGKEDPGGFNHIEGSANEDLANTTTGHSDEVGSTDFDTSDYYNSYLNDNDRDNEVASSVTGGNANVNVRDLTHIDEDVIRKKSSSSSISSSESESIGENEGNVPEMDTENNGTNDDLNCPSDRETTERIGLGVSSLSLDDDSKRELHYTVPPVEPKHKPPRVPSPVRQKLKETSSAVSGTSSETSRKRRIPPSHPPPTVFASAPAHSSPTVSPASHRPSVSKTTSLTSSSRLRHKVSVSSTLSIPSRSPASKSTSKDQGHPVTASNAARAVLTHKKPHSVPTSRINSKQKLTPTGSSDTTSSPRLRKPTNVSLEPQLSKNPKPSKVKKVSSKASPSTNGGTPTPKAKKTVKKSKSAGVTSVSSPSSVSAPASKTTANTRSTSTATVRTTSLRDNSNVPTVAKKASKSDEPTPTTSMTKSNSDTSGSLGDRTSREELEERIIDSLTGVDRQAAKQIFQEIVVHGDNVRWDDIAGLTTAKNSLKESVVYPYLRPDLFHGLREPITGMLLFGPPGTGKTMLARAVARESKATFFSISASSLTSKYLGESEKLVRALFAVARKLAPSIIFVDEIDSIMGSRDKEGENESTRRIKTEFLIQWSNLSSAAAGSKPSSTEPTTGIDGNTTNDNKSSVEEEDGRVLVLAATNLPWSIDEAARRRFVRRQYIPLPEPETRLLQFKKLLSHQKHTLSDEDFAELIELTDGYSGSDITSLAKDAAMGPLRDLGDQLLFMDREDIRPIGLIDFKNSLEYIKPSVSKDGLQQYEEWAEKYGSSGS